MSKQVESSFFIASSIGRYAAFYQQLLKGIVGHEELASRVLFEIKTAHAFRQTDKVRELAYILVHIPLKEPRLIGQCYLAWCDCREQNYQPTVLERIVEQTSLYKAQALISRAAIDFYQGKFDDALRFYVESLRAQPTASEYVLAVKGIAVIKSIEGFAGQALKDLSSLAPILRYSDPIVCFDYLNSYAVELGNAGQLNEARNVARLVLASPFAGAYPEWRETGNEIALRSRCGSRSVVSFPQTTTGTQTIIDPQTTADAISSRAAPQNRNLLHLPAREYETAAEPTATGLRATVLDMQNWKKKMTNHEAKRPRPTTDKEKQARMEELLKLTPREVLVRIMESLGDESVGADLLRKALMVLEGIEPDSNQRS